MQKGAWRPDGRSPRARSSRRRCASADEGRQRISSRYGALREPSSLSLAAFSANRLSSHRQRQSLHLAIRQTAPLWDYRFEGKRSPRSIDRGRGAQEEQTNTLVVHGMRYYTDLPGYGDGERSSGLPTKNLGQSPATQWRARERHRRIPLPPLRLHFQSEHEGCQKTYARLRCRAEKLECGLSARLRNSIAEGSAFLADRAMQVSPVALSEVHARS